MNIAPPAIKPASRRVKLAGISVVFAAVVGCGQGGDRPDADRQGNSSIESSSANAATRPKPIDAKHPVVRIDTNLGEITLKLDGVSAPGTVRNFLNNATEGFYDNTIVHYVDPGKMFVSGGYTADRQPKTARTPIRNEAHNGLKNVRGSIAMTRDPNLVDSATSQFFINLEDAPQRDHQGETAEQYGYCVFGHVTDGLDVADKISRSPTTALAGDLGQTPDPPVLIRTIRVMP